MVVSLVRVICVVDDDILSFLESLQHLLEAPYGKQNFKMSLLEIGIPSNRLMTDTPFVGISKPRRVKLAHVKQVEPLVRCNCGLYRPRTASSSYVALAQVVLPEPVAPIGPCELGRW